MNIEFEPRAALNKAFRKVKPGRAEFETFKAQVGVLLSGIKAGESEEFHKNLIADFLKKSYYDAHAINTKERNDLVIHEGKTSDTPVVVILETKKPDNKSEMLTVNRPQPQSPARTRPVLPARTRDEQKFGRQTPHRHEHL